MSLRHPGLIARKANYRLTFSRVGHPQLQREPTKRVVSPRCFRSDDPPWWVRLMTVNCRVLAHEVGDGPSNMALDEALLDFVATDPSMAILRTYEWSSPTLSLGYFQPIAEAKADSRWQDVPIVRRPTGGGALWHDREVTYAVVIPGEHPAARPSRALYRTIHGAIIDHLNSLAIPADRRGEQDGGDGQERRPFLCFTDRDPEDIVFRGFKLVGSAQRRRSGAVLQHGSLLLACSRKTPELPGISNITSVSSDPAIWGETLKTILPQALGLVSMSENIPPEVRRRADLLAAEFYGNETWTSRR
jgi:lipoyl(octanoyl) transferase